MDPFHSPEFWTGAALLGAYQFAKFNELRSPDPDFAARSALIPNLRAIDFAGRLTYSATLVAFLAATFLIYFVLCKISPAILSGWAQVSGASPDEKLTKFVNTVNYPLYIAAVYMGVAQQGIPLLSNIGNMQRNLFHAWMVSPPKSSSVQLFRHPDLRAQPGCRAIGQGGGGVEKRRLGGTDRRLCRHGTLRTPFARLKLDDEPELHKATRRELNIFTRQLVDVASLATVRESGVASLSRLADDLRVSMLPNSAWPKAFLAGGILFLVGMTSCGTLFPRLTVWQRSS